MELLVSARFPLGSRLSESRQARGGTGKAQVVRVKVEALHGEVIGPKFHDGVVEHVDELVACRVHRAQPKRHAGRCWYCGGPGNSFRLKPKGFLWSFFDDANRVGISTNGRNME